MHLHRISANGITAVISFREGELFEIEVEDEVAKDKRNLTFSRGFVNETDFLMEMSVLSMTGPHYSQFARCRRVMDKMVDFFRSSCYFDGGGCVRLTVTKEELCSLDE